MVLIRSRALWAELFVLWSTTQLHGHVMVHGPVEWGHGGCEVGSFPQGEGSEISLALTLQRGED